MKMHLATGASGVLLLVCLLANPAFAQVPQDDPRAVAALKALGEKASLTADELAQARAAMLKLNNDARLNKDYRRQKGLTQDAELPADLSPLVLSDNLNAAAQEQAESAAGSRRVAQDKQVPGPLASGTGSLTDFPIGWQSSNSMHRPTWNLGGTTVDSVGFGMAKNPQSGSWSVVAIWADLGGAKFNDLGLHDLANVKKLAAFSDKASLTPEEMQSVRESMLQMNNEARANPEYRRKMKSKQDLDLPSGLPPLVLDDAANKAAQEQAEYQASIATVTHDNRNYRDLGHRVSKFNITGVLEACGGSTNLVDYPTSWMMSDTHYRPTWNIVQPVRRVGYGFAKNSRDGKWYCTAIWRPVEANETPAPTAPPTPAMPTAGNPPADPFAPPAASASDRIWGDQTPAERRRRSEIKTITGAKAAAPTYRADSKEMQLVKGAILCRGDRMFTPDRAYCLVINPDGALAIYDRDWKLKWSGGSGGTHAEFQATDGNFCLYNDKKEWKWGTQMTGEGVVNGSIRLTHDGVLEQVDATGYRVWSSPRNP